MAYLRVSACFKGNTVIDGIKIGMFLKSRGKKEQTRQNCYALHTFPNLFYIGSLVDCIWQHAVGSATFVTGIRYVKHTSLIISDLV
jgi:hypothetical protein